VKLSDNVDKSIDNIETNNRTHVPQPCSARLCGVVHIHRVINSLSTVISEQKKIPIALGI
jgi:hypothetical protein